MFSGWKSVINININVLHIPISIEMQYDLSVVIYHNEHEQKYMIQKWKIIESPISLTAQKLCNMV